MPCTTILVGKKASFDGSTMISRNDDGPFETKRIEVMKPDGSNPEVTVRSICDADGTPMESAPHPQQELHVDLGMQPEPFDILRMRC